MKKGSIAFGLTGCGAIGKRHAKLMRERGLLVAVCDPILERAQNFAQEFSTNAYFDQESMLLAHPEIELVSVCTPNALHAANSIEALKYGCHVLCEKPMAINTVDCHAMITAANLSGKRLFVVKQNRYNPPVVAVKKLLQEKQLGEIFSVQVNCFWNRNSAYYKDSWKGTAALDGGTLFTQFSHFIDILYWLIGDIVDAQAIIGNFGHANEIEFEDTGVVILQFENGAIGSLHYNVNSFSKNMEGSITIFARNGTVKIGGQYLNHLEYQDVGSATIDYMPISSPANDYGYYQGSMSNHDKVYDNILDVLFNNDNMMTTPEEALKTVEIITRIKNAAKVVTK